MKKSTIILSLILGSLSAQFLVQAQTDSVPAVSISATQFERILIVRLKTKTDLLEGLKQAVKNEAIKNAVILTGIGSVTEFNVHAVNATVFPPEDIFLNKKGPYDIANVSGYVFDGRIHAHITLSDLKTTIGGHLEPGTLAYTFAIITIGVLPDDAKLENFDNWKWY